MKLTAFCLLALLAPALVTPAIAAPAMWEVRDGDSALTLFGSFHILPEDANWRTPLFDAALEQADFVVLETALGPEAMAQVGASAFARGIYTDGTLLTDRIDAQTEMALRSALAEIGVPAGTVLAMRPWMAANTISVAALTGLGFSMQGVELSVEPALAEERMRYLETGDEQLDVLSGAPEDEQIAMLSATLEQLPLLPKIMDKMLRNWIGGTPDRLIALFRMEMGGFEEAFMDRLLNRRNRNWLPALEQMLADNEENLVIVGAAHLLGDGSVLDLLQQAGYTVERVQ